MRFLRSGLLAAASLVVLAGACRGEDAGLLLRGQPGGLQPAALHRRAPPSTPARGRSTIACIEPDRGEHRAQAGAGRELSTISDDGLVYTFKLRQDVKFQTTEDFTPTRDFNADDVVFSFERQRDPEPSLQQGVRRQLRILRGLGPAAADQVGREGRRHAPSRFTLNSPDATFLPLMSQDFASILSAEYADEMMQAGTPEQLDLNPVGTGPFQLVAYQKDAVIRYKANPDYWRGQGGARQSRLRDHARRLGALAEAEGRRVPRHALQPNPADIPAMQGGPERQPAPAGGAERRLSRLQRREEAVRRQARAPGADHGDQQAGDHRCGLSGCGRRGQEPDAADDLGLQRRHRGLRPTIRTAAKKLLDEAGGHGLQDRPLGDAGDRGPTTPTPGAWPSWSRPTGRPSASTPRSSPSSGASI